MGKNINLSHLIGKTIGRKDILGHYRIIKLLDDTTKTLGYKAKHIALGRDDFLKVLRLELIKNEERVNQILEEAQTMVQIGRLDNLPIVYSMEKEEDYIFIAIELLKNKEGNLQTVVNSIKNKSREKLSLEEIVNIMDGATKGVDNLHTIAGINHGDIKLKNILRTLDGTTYIIDVGGRITENEEYSGDIPALGNSFLELFSVCKEKIPKDLEKMVERSTDTYESIEDFKSDFEDYKFWNSKIKPLIIGPSISRRKFLKTAGSAIALAGLGSLGYLGNKYVNSMDYIVNEIRKVDATDYKNIDPLFKELKFRIFDQKIRGLVEDEKIPRGESPFGTIENGSWYTSETRNFANGFWRGILWEGYEKTEDEQFKDWALERTNEIQLSPEDTKHNIAVRFFYSHAKAYDIIEDEQYKDNALNALEIFVERFDEKTGFIAPISEQPYRSEAGTMMDIVPFLLWGYKVTGNDNYLKIAKNHTMKVANFHIRKDGSVRKTAILDPRTHKVIEEQNSKGISPESTLSRAQSQMLFGLVESFKFTKDPLILDAAKKVANYFLDEKNLPADYVPYFDFQAPKKPETSRDSSAAAILLPSLLGLSKLTNDKIYPDMYRKIKKSLILNYLSTDLENYCGILKSACSNWQGKTYTNSSLIYGDYHFLTS